jgi:hypothetical protein
MEVRDRTSGIKYIIDTGASASILHASEEDRKKLESKSMSAANGTMGKKE